MTATHEFVVPKSMPIIFPICLKFSLDLIFLRLRAARGGGLVQSHYYSLVGYCQVLFECVGLNNTLRARSARICTKPGWPSREAVERTCMSWFFFRIRSTMTGRSRSRWVPGVRK